MLTFFLSSVRSTQREEHETTFGQCANRNSMIGNMATHVKEHHLNMDCEGIRDVTALQRAEEWASPRKFVAHAEGDWELFTAAIRKGTGRVGVDFAARARAASLDERIAQLLSLWSEPQKVVAGNDAPRWQFQCKACPSCVNSS